MLKFLVTVILAIIIFAPACVFLSKYFRLSDQARDSFNEFTDILSDVEQGENSELFLLKLDRETALAYFEPNKEKVFVFVQGLGDLNMPGQGPSADIYFNRPDSCTDNTKACLCLLQNIEGDRKYIPDDQRERCAGENNCGLAIIQGEGTFSATKGRCIQDITLPVSLSTCSIGIAHSSQGYYCQHGFVIERELLKEKGFPSYFVAPRRIALQIEKKENTVLITPQ